MALILCASMLLFLLLVILAYKLHRKQNDPKNIRFNELIKRIPSPTPSRIPFVGHLRLLSNEITKHGDFGLGFFQFNKNLCTKFRTEGIYVVNLGPISGLFVNIFKASLLKDCLSDRVNINKSSMYKLMKLLGENGLASAKGEVWKHGRKLIQPAFSFKAMEQFSQSFNKTADKFLKFVRKNVVNDLQSVLSYYTLKSLLATTVGMNADDADDAEDADDPDDADDPNDADDPDGTDDFELREYLKQAHIFQECFIKRFSNVFLHSDTICSLTETGRRMKKSIEKLNKFSDDAIIKRHNFLERNKGRKEEESKGNRCLIDILLLEHETEPLDRKINYIRDHVNTFIFAGHDTVALTLKNTLFLLASHPLVQERVHKEIDEILSREDVEHIRAKELKLPYIEAVINESLRLLPPAPIFGREVTSEMKVGEYTLPVGCYTSFNVFDLMRDPEQFEEPNEFNPERFMDGNEEKDKRDKHAFLPFSGGLRNCIGEKYAMMEMKIFLIKILYHFEVSTSLRFEDITLYLGLTLNTKEKIDMSFKERVHE